MPDNTLGSSAHSGLETGTSTSSTQLNASRPAQFLRQRITKLKRENEGNHLPTILAFDGHINRGTSTDVAFSLLCVICSRLIETLGHSQRFMDKETSQFFRHRLSFGGREGRVDKDTACSIGTLTRDITLVPQSAYATGKIVSFPLFFRADSLIRKIDR